MNIPVAHVEAGLRSYNMSMPEEINRILTDRISDLLFCPTQQAVSNLEKEGFKSFDVRVVKTGDIMKDSVSFFKGRLEVSDSLARLGVSSNGFILATIHRQENTNSKKQLRSIFEGLESLSKDLPVVLPLHPRTRAAMKEFDLVSQIKLIEPVGYREMQQLLHHCAMVITDSGGLQKEAYFHKKPCLVLREQTEWVELTEAGLARLVGSEAGEIRKAYDAFSQSDLNFGDDLYGTEPGESIYKEIVDYLNLA